MTKTEREALLRRTVDAATNDAADNLFQDGGMARAALSVIEAAITDTIEDALDEMHAVIEDLEARVAELEAEK